MTIYQLKKLNEKHGGCFFSRGTMERYRDTLKGFSVKQNPVCKNEVIVSRKRTNNSWIFSKITGRFIVHKSA